MPHRSMLVALAALLLVSSASGQEGPLERLESRRIDLSFIDLPLAHVLEFLSEQTGVPFLIDPWLQRNRTEDELRVRIQLSDVSARTAFETLQTLLGLGHDVVGPAIYVTDRERIRDDSVVAVHDVGDLCALQDATNVADDSGWLAIDLISQFIEENIAPDTWDPPHSITARERRLVVRHSPAVQARIRRFLDLLRSKTGRLVDVEVSIYRLDRSTTDAIRAEGPFAGGDLPTRLDRRIAAAEGTDEALLRRLVLTSFGGRPAAARALTASPVLGGYSPFATPPDQAVGPEVDDLAEPVDVGVQPIVSADGGTIWLHLSLDATALLDRPTVETPRGRLSMPRTRRQAIETTAPVPAGRSLAVELGASTVAVFRPSIRDIAGLAPPPIEPDEAAIRRARFLEELEAREIEASFHDDSLAEVVEVLRRKGGFNVAIAREIEEEFEPGSLSVTLDVGTISVRELLTLLERLLPVRFELADRILIVRGLDRVDDRTVLAAYDIRHVEVEVGQARLDLDLAPPPREPSSESAVFWEDSSGGAPITRDMLEDLISTTVAPESWDEMGNGIQIYDGLLLVTTTPEVQAQVAAFLETLETGSRGAVRFVITRFRSGPRLGAALGDARLVLGPEAVATLARDLAEDSERFAMVTLENRWTSIGRVDETRYLTSSQTGPTSGALLTGAHLDLSATAHAGGAFLLGLDARTASDLGRAEPTTIDGLALENPRVDRTRNALTVALEAGQALLLPTGGPADADGRLEYLLVEVERIE